MDDAFSLVASRMPRTRRFTPFGVRLAAMLVTVLALIVGFGVFVASQQRAADERRTAAVARQQASDAAEAQAAAERTTALGTVEGAARPPTAQTTRLLDDQARENAQAALAAAGSIAADSSFGEARTAALAAIRPDLMFVDGESTAPSIVSVYTGAAGWAAAVHGANDACFWVAVTPAGQSRYGTGGACTGMAALAADSPGW